MLELLKLGRSFKMFIFLWHIFILSFVYHSESFQNFSVCVHFDIVSCQSSEEESLHILSNRQQQILYCYRTSGATFVVSRLCLVTETAC